MKTNKNINELRYLKLFLKNCLGKFRMFGFM